MITDSLEALDGCYPQCCGSRMFIPDPRSEFFASRIPGKKFPDPDLDSYKIIGIFNPTNYFLALGNMIRDVHSGSRS
jgi:hypothetical protein